MAKISISVVLIVDLLYEVIVDVYQVITMDEHDSFLEHLVVITDLRNDMVNTLHNIQTTTEMVMMTMEMKILTQVEVSTETMMINHSEMLRRYSLDQSMSSIS